jgi:hypothetical protein
MNQIAADAYAVCAFIGALAIAASTFAVVMALVGARRDRKWQQDRARYASRCVQPEPAKDWIGEQLDREHMQGLL